jgi:hypothetical protein
MVENLFQIVHKSATLAPHRYSLVLLKVGCPIGCSEWLPVSKPFYDECQEGEVIEVKVKRVSLSVDQAYKLVAAHRQQPLTSADYTACAVGGGCSVEYEIDTV